MYLLFSGAPEQNCESYWALFAKLYDKNGQELPMRVLLLHDDTDIIMYKFSQVQSALQPESE